MDEATKRAVFANAAIIAYADAQLDPREKTILGAFIDAAGITPEQARGWLAELRGGDLAFRRVPDAAAARAALRVAVGVVAADGELDRRERLALYDLAKALGIAAPELRRIY